MLNTRTVGKEISATRLDYLDATRAIAAFLVVVVHVSQLYPQSHGLWTLSQMGQLGVQLFFVASAFTITASLERLSSEPHAMKRFFIFRFFRIAPLFYLGILTYFIATQLSFFDTAPHIPRPQYSILNTIGHFFLLNGIYPRGGNTLVPGEWSIGAECLFYAIAPLLFQLRHSTIKLITLGIFCLFAIQLLALAASIITGRYTLVENNGILFYLIINQLPVFLVGIYLYANKIILFNYSAMKCWGGVVIGICLMWSLWWSTMMEGILYSVIPVLAAVTSACLIIALSKIKNLPYYLIELGRRSY
ncbi:MAG: hypothetical protein RIR39_1877 [Pseudomonadota bacterium]|jgi:peptidoglycan/LPS O-acetylase OafA/YrhL